MLTVLFFGDVVGKAGRRGLAAVLPALRQEFKPDVVIVNGENAAHGNGINAKTYGELREAGADVVTLGDHAFDRTEVRELLARESGRLLRPVNFPAGAPGIGAALVPVGSRQLAVVNLLGRVFMKRQFDCPFRAFDALREQYRGMALAGLVVDFHAEATSEKSAFGWYVDGRASAVVGTHTHAPTADARILPGGTAVVSDVGMVGSRDSVIGVKRQAAITGFLQQMPVVLEPAEDSPCQVNGVLIQIDPATGRAHHMRRLDTEVAV